MATSSCSIPIDCLDKSKNADQKEYGIERIKKSIKSAKGETARQVFDSIMSDFYAYMDGQVLHDDLTVIVLVRKG